MDPPLVAASASDAAGLGVQLAQDLYRLASEYPSVECQIGRIAQAFVDLNLTLSDLASALPSAAGSPVSLSLSCMGRIVSLIDRIHGVQKTFFEGLNEDASSPSSKKQPAAAAAKKSNSKLGRLKTLFPGSGADERFTEMEWMRNTLALFAAVLRLAVAQAETGSSADSTSSLANQTRFRIASETLTSAVIIYVRVIEQRIADPDGDDQSDDEEPITGPGSLLYVAPVPPPPPKETKKGKSKVKKQLPVEPKVDAADWIYQNLRDRIKEHDRAENLSSQFVDWLLEESVVLNPVEITEYVEATLAETADDKSTDATGGMAPKDTDTIEAAPEPEPAPVFLSKKALKKLAKNKGKAKAVATPAAEPEPKAEAEKVDDKVGTTTVEDDDIAMLEKAIADAQAAIASSSEEKAAEPGGADAVPEAPATDQSGTPKATAAAQAEPSKFKDAKFGRHDIEQDHDDLPPPYPSPDAFMPPGSRGAPFGPSHFPYPGANPMAYQTAPGAPFDMPPYMQPQAAMFHGVGFYPAHMPYMAAASQPFYGPRGAAAGDAYGAADPYDSHGPARPFPGMRRGSIERPIRDAPPGRDSGRGGALVPRRRAGTYGGKYDEEEHFDDDIPANRRRGPTTGRRRRDTDESQETNDDKEKKQDGPSNKTPGDNADHEKDDTAPTEMSLERVSYRPKKGSRKAVADDEEKRHYSDAETIDIRDAAPIASNSSKKRNAKAVTHVGMKSGQSSKESSPPPATVLPTPPTPPSAAGEDDEVAEASTSKSKKSRAKSKGKNTGKAKPKEIEEHHSDMEPEAKDKDDSEYESANEGNDDKSDDDDEDDDHDDDHDHEDETQFSPDTEHRVFTPPPTPPHVPHPGEAPIPPPAAPMHPHTPQPGGPPGATAAPGGYHGMPPYFAQPQNPSMMGAYPYQAQRTGGPEAAAAGYGPNVDMGMGPAGAGAGAGIEQLWASFLSERMGMPPPAAPWTPAGAAATAGMDGPRDGPPVAKGMSSNWIRGEDHAMPVRGPPPQVSSAPPPPQRTQQPQKSQQRNRCRSRMHDDDHDHDHRGRVYEHSEDEDYDDYGHHDRRDHYDPREPRDRRDSRDSRDHRDHRDDYDDRGPARRDPYHAADYPPRRRSRSRSPPYHSQDRRRDYHEQQRQQRPRYHQPDDSPPRGWERDERDDRHDRHDARGDPRSSPPNHHHGGGQHHQQQTPQQQYRNPYHAYYDQQRRPSFSKGSAPATAPAPAAAEWGWPGDVKQPLHPHPQQSQMPMPPQQMPPHMPQMQMQMPPMPQMTPQMPLMFPQAPPHHGGGHPPPPGWDDGWNETYRQGRGHAEFAMTEIDG